MPPLHAAAVIIIRALELVQTLLERANIIDIVIHNQHSLAAPSLSSSSCHNNNNDDHRLPLPIAILHEVIQTYASEMSHSEQLFFLCIALAILLFGIILPLWEAINYSSPCSSTDAAYFWATSKKKKTQKKNNSKTVWPSHEWWDHPSSENDGDGILVKGMSPPCQLKIYVPGTGVVLLARDDVNDSNNCSSSSSSSCASLTVPSSSWNDNNSSSSGCSSKNNCIFIRRGSSVGSSHSSSCGSWCMETIQESEEEDDMDEDDEYESDDEDHDNINYNSLSALTGGSAEGCGGSCPDLDETTTTEEEDDDEDDANDKKIYPLRIMPRDE